MASLSSFPSRGTTFFNQINLPPYGKIVAGDEQISISTGRVTFIDPEDPLPEHASSAEDIVIRKSAESTPDPIVPELYFWKVGRLDDPQWIVDPAGGIDVDFTSIQSAIADINVKNGDVLLLKNGVYDTNNLIISKSVALVGESRDGCILQEGTLGSPVSSQVGISIDADDVVLYNLSVEHFSNSVLGIAVSVSGATTGPTGFQAHQCTIRYSELGFYFRAKEWTVKDCTLEYNGVLPSGTKRGFLTHSLVGDCFITNVLFKTVGFHVNLRAIQLSASSGTIPFEIYNGRLFVIGCSQEGSLFQFLIQDSFGPNAGVRPFETPAVFELVVRENIINESNAFVILVPAAQVVDIYRAVYFENNTISNFNEGTDGGKGLFGIDAAWIGAGNFVRTDNHPLTFYFSENVFGQDDLRTPYVKGTGAEWVTTPIVGYRPPNLGDAPVRVLAVEYLPEEIRSLNGPEAEISRFIKVEDGTSFLSAVMTPLLNK